MANDPSEDMSAPQLVAQPGFLGRHVLLAGVVGACALGVGAGLWARPAADDRRTAPVQARPAAAPKPAGRLEIVVDDSPAPIGAPIEVLPAFGAPSPAAPLLAEPPPPVEATPLAPIRPPAGLVRVQAVEPIAVEPEPSPPPRPLAKPIAKAERKAERKPVTAKTPARVEPAPKSRKPAADRKVAKVEAAPRKARPRGDDKPAKAKLAKAAPRKAKATAAAETRKPGKLGKALAKVAPKKVQDAAKASKSKLAEARKARAERVRIETAKVEKARLEKTKLEKAKLEKAKLAKARVRKAEAAKARAERAKVVKAAAPKPVPRAAKPPKPTRDNPVRKASNRCASADPGEAIVCADPSLGAADRQLARAYRQAEAAGVSAAQLARQQQRWLAARAQAAREAPWAVRDVYEARIAELNDMTRGARTEY